MDKQDLPQDAGDGLVDSERRGGRRQVVKAAACGAAIRGFESPRSPFHYQLRLL